MNERIFSYELSSIQEENKEELMQQDLFQEHKSNRKQGNIN